MDTDNGKISTRQAMLFIIVLFCAPSIRYIPLFTATQAKQAAWIAPLIAIVFEVIYILIWSKFIERFDKKSYIDIIKEILGNIPGKIVCVVYFLWLTLLLTYNLRMYAERIVSTAMPNMHIVVVTTAMIVVVFYIVKNGIICLAKMNELLVLLLAFIFLTYNILILPKIQINNLFPITYKDIFPAFKANFGVLAIFAYNILIFMFNDKIDYKKGEFKKLGLKTVVILTIISLLVIVIPVCVFGWSVLIKMPIPYLNTMMEISIFDTIERIEAGIVMFWIITDFMLISIFIYSAMHIIKVFFKISDVRPILSIYMFGILFLSFILAKSTLELKMMSENILTQMNVLMGFFVPIIIFIIGKVRKKV